MGNFRIKKFKKDVLFRAKAIEQLSTKTSHTIQKDFNTHVLMDLPGRFINHRFLIELNMHLIHPLKISQLLRKCWNFR
jgi:hypothetical protein